MAEYNWRKEREKYRPDFMKQPEQEQPSAPPPPPTRRPYTGVIVAVIAVTVIVAATAVFLVTRKTSDKQVVSATGNSGDSAVMLAQVAERYKNAVGLVVLTVELSNGRKIPVPIGTAWAFAPDKFATNAHVAQGLPEGLKKLRQLRAASLLEEQAKQKGFKNVSDYLKSLGKERAEALARNMLAAAAKDIRNAEGSILINGTFRKSYPLKQVQIHRDFGVAGSKFDPDVAVLTIDGKHDVFFGIAPEKTLTALKSGEPIAFLGFPMENLDSGNVNIENPVASMQSGIVVAVSDFEMKDAGAARNYLIRHNLPSTGGASGSPIFNRKGEIVALLFAVNIVGQVKNGQVERTPSAAQINFAIRSDLLRGMGAPVAIGEFLAK